MLGNLTGWHFLIIALVVLLLFGATRLPALAKGVGQSMKIFKSEMKNDEDGNKKDSDASDSSAKSEAVPQADSTESKPKS